MMFLLPFPQSGFSLYEGASGILKPGCELVKPHPPLLDQFGPWCGTVAGLHPLHRSGRGSLQSWARFGGELCAGFRGRDWPALDLYLCCPHLDLASPRCLLQHSRYLAWAELLFQEQIPKPSCTVFLSAVYSRSWWAQYYPHLKWCIVRAFSKHALTCLEVPASDD